ncbi:MAG TPA: ABC transporter substrate-binding protein [Patescibacteria group bacterium]
MKKFFRRKFFWLPLFFIICIALLFSLGLDDVFLSQHEIRIGLIAELSGSMKSVGQSSKQAVELAVNEVNAAGGVMVAGVRYPIHLITLDNKSSVSETENDVSQLNREHVAAIIGPNASSYAQAAAKVAEREKVVLISPWSTQDNITLINNKPSTYIFRAGFTESFQEKSLAYFASNILKADKATIIYDAKTQVLKQQADFFSSYFKNTHGVIVDVIGFNNPQNLSQQLAMLMQKKPDMIFLPAYTNDAVSIIHAIHTQNIKISIVGSDSWGGEQMIKVCGQDCNGYYISSHFNQQNTNPVTHDFVTTYQKQFKTTPDDIAALSYDATNIILQAINKAGGTSHEDIAQAMHAIENFNGVTGYITFTNKSNDPQKNIYINQIQNGVIKFVQAISPKDIEE